MKSKIIFSIVPRLPPSIDGLGDYGFTLAKQIRQDFGVQTEFIVTDPKWFGESFIEGFKIHKISSRSAHGLIDLLSKNQDSLQTVLLHYVGYGYAKRGCPIWLIRALTKWRHNNDSRNLITMFHEVYAFGPVWTSQFWTSPLQRYLAAKLSRISDHCLTSKTIYSEIICKFSKGKHSRIPVLPIFSNIGEPHNLKSLIDREKRIIIFGNKGPRARVYKESRTDLEKICLKFKITEIFDIGPPLEYSIEPIGGIKITILGIKSAEEISLILANSIIGYINYPTAYLVKSGIFAAYCAHRILPIVSWYENQQIDNAIENVHYWSGKNDYPLSASLIEAQVIADNANYWYQEHCLSVHAQNFFEFF